MSASKLINQNRVCSHRVNRSSTDPIDSLSVVEMTDLIMKNSSLHERWLSNTDQNSRHLRASLCAFLKTDRSKKQKISKNKTTNTGTKPKFQYSKVGSYWRDRGKYQLYLNELSSQVAQHEDKSLLQQDMLFFSCIMHLYHFSYSNVIGPSRINEWNCTTYALITDINYKNLIAKVRGYRYRNSSSFYTSLENILDTVVYYLYYNTKFTKELRFTWLQGHIIRALS